MSPDPSPLNPSQAVERIREIIVGRHLERIEQRVADLESGSSPAQIPVEWEDRLCTNEAKLEALQHSLQRLAESTREDAIVRTQQQQLEIQRLAAQIQQVASRRSAEVDHAGTLQLEQKIGTWLNHWQGSLQTHLKDRETRLAEQLRQEVASLWENTESQLTRLESRSLDRDTIEERFGKIAAAARALAECAAPSSSSTDPLTS